MLKPASLVLILKDVFQNHNFISFQELSNKCNIKNINAGKIMSHLRKHIDSNILGEIREGPANQLSNHLQIKIDTDHEDYTDICQIPVKTSYRNLIKNAFIRPTSEKRWPQILNINDNLKWDEIWNKACFRILDHDDSDLWFRLRNRILSTKDILHKMGKVKEIKCGLCKIESESIEHLFIYCSITMESWIFMENIPRKYKGKIHFSLNDSNRILGYGKNIGNIALWLIAKLHKTIWVTRCNHLEENNPVKAADLKTKYQRNLKYQLRLEQNRLLNDEFMSIYGKRNALCSIQGHDIKFQF